MAASSCTGSVIVEKGGQPSEGDADSPCTSANGSVVDGCGAASPAKSTTPMTPIGTAVSFQDDTAAVVLSSGEVVCFPKNKEFIAKYSGTSACPSVGEIAKMISKADCSTDVARFRVSVTDGLREQRPESSDGSPEQPLHSIAVAEVGTRELTVGELLLGRRQQLTTLKRLKQRIQDQKRRLEMEQLRAEEMALKIGGPQQRRKYARTPRVDDEDDQKPLCAITLEELARRSWGQKRAMRRFDAEDFIHLHNLEIARRRNLQNRYRRWEANFESKRETCDMSPAASFADSTIGLSELCAAAETLSKLAFKVDTPSTVESTSTVDESSSNFLLNSAKRDIDYDEFVNARSPSEVAASASALISSIPLLSSTASSASGTAHHRPPVRSFSDSVVKEFAIDHSTDGEAFEHYLAAAIDNLSYDLPKGTRKAIISQAKAAEESVSPATSEVKRPIFWKKLAKYRRAVEKKDVSDLEEQEELLNALVRHAYRLKWILARKPKARDDERKIAGIDELVETTYKRLNSIRLRRSAENSGAPLENVTTSAVASTSASTESTRCTRSMKKRARTATNSAAEDSFHTSSLGETKQFVGDILGKLTAAARAYAETCCPKRDEGAAKGGTPRRKRRVASNIHLERKIRKKEALLKLIATFVDFDAQLRSAASTPPEVANTAL